MTKLIAATGFIGGGSSAEVINLDDSNPNLICDNLPNLPYSLYGPVGHLFRGVPIICAGFSNQVEKRCNSLQNGTWKSMPNMTEVRYDPVSVILSPTGNETLYIAGGHELSSVESFDGKNFNQITIPNLPNQIFVTCMVKINNSMAMLIGGSTDGNTADIDKTYFFDVIQKKWVPGPQLPVPRGWHFCGVMNWKNPATNVIEKVIVVAGGILYQQPLTNSVELLFLNDFENNNSGWKVGPSIPVRVDGSAMVEFQNGVIMIGGRGERNGRHLYQLSSPYGKWTEMKQTLKEPRSHFVSFLVPDELVSCH